MPPHIEGWVFPFRACPTVRRGQKGCVKANRSVFLEALGKNRKSILFSSIHVADFFFYMFTTLFHQPFYRKTAQIHLLKSVYAAKQC
jgi:hypothetical protein